VTTEAVQYIILGARALSFAVALFLAVRLGTAFISNGFHHKPLRWLIGWLSSLFGALALEQGLRIYARVEYVYHDAATTSLSDPIHVFAALACAVSAMGVLWTWLQFPLGEGKA
jgi:hypothetical protein